MAIEVNHTCSQRNNCSGTIQYMAPEVLDEKTELKSDVWSFGIALIEMMGITLFYGYRNNRLPIRKGEFSFPFDKGDIESEELLDFLMQCFKRVEERWSVKELLIVSVM